MKLFYDKTETIKTKYYKTDVQGVTLTKEGGGIGTEQKICLYHTNPNLFPIFLNKNCFDKKSLMEYVDYDSFLEKHIIEINIDDINKYSLYFRYNAGHMLFDSKMIPQSLPISFNYIGSLREQHAGDQLYQKLVDLLRKHPFILNLKDYVIPYYNADFSGQRGVEHAIALISQEKYQKLYDKYKNEEYVSSLMKEEITLNCVTDLYGSDIEDILYRV
jgi:hypothetical protein